MLSLHRQLPIITLTTDFGGQDPYVAAMKGVIMTICPRAVIIDLTHEIAPQDIFSASLFIADAAPWFPRDTIHLVVIDPGVGSARLPLAVKAGAYTFICPDNGLLTHFLQRQAITDYQAYILTASRYRLKKQSTTFHGRDIFAPAAAYLARRLAIRKLGPRQETIASLPVSAPFTDSEGIIRGEIVHLDHFGNAITNLGHSYVLTETASRGKKYIQGRLASGKPDMAPLPIVSTYSCVAVLAPCLLWGSSGYLEVAINQGHAAQRLGLHKGDKLFLCPE